MTVYTDEVNIYNTDAIAQGIENAGAANAMVTAVGTDGVKVHPAGQSGSGIVDYTLVDANGVKLYKGGVSVASFGDSATIGKANGPRTVIQSSGVDFYGASDGSVNLAHIGYGEGAATTGTATRPYFTFGTRAANSANGNYSVAEGYNITASAAYSHAEGYASVARGMYSHAQNRGTIALTSSQTVMGKYNEAETETDTFTGDGSTTVFTLSKPIRGMVALTIDGALYPSGYTWAYIEGDNKVSFATKSAPPAGASISIEYVTNNYALIIGNGTSDTSRSNAAELQWNGTLRLHVSGTFKSNTENGIMLEDDTGHGRSMLFGLGSGHIARGIYDRKLNRWITYADDTSVYAGVVNTTSKDAAKKSLGIAAGSISTITVAANSYAESDAIDIRSYGFTSTPTIVVGFYSTAAAGGFGKCSVSVSSASSTSFKVRVFNGDTTQRAPALRWIAVGN